MISESFSRTDTKFQQTRSPKSAIRMRHGSRSHLQIDEIDLDATFASLVSIRFFFNENLVSTLTLYRSQFGFLNSFERLLYFNQSERNYTTIVNHSSNAKYSKSLSMELLSLHATHGPENALLRKRLRRVLHFLSD